MCRLRPQPSVAYVHVCRAPEGPPRCVRLPLLPGSHTGRAWREEAGARPLRWVCPVPQPGCSPRSLPLRCQSQLAEPPAIGRAASQLGRGCPFPVSAGGSLLRDAIRLTSLQYSKGHGDRFRRTAQGGEHELRSQSVLSAAAVPEEWGHHPPSTWLCPPTQTLLEPPLWGLCIMSPRKHDGFRGGLGCLGARSDSFSVTLLEQSCDSGVPAQHTVFFSH